MSKEDTAVRRKTLSGNIFAYAAPFMLLVIAACMAFFQGGDSLERALVGHMLEDHMEYSPGMSGQVDTSDLIFVTFHSAASFPGSPLLTDLLSLWSSQIFHLSCGIIIYNSVLTELIC